MRRDIVHEGAQNLRYEIREIVTVAHEIRDLGQEMTWENIGDPIQKGEELAPWIREILCELLSESASYASCDTAGVPETRAFLADAVNQREGGVQVTADDILFFNGIGDAVARVYGGLKREARVLGPSPAYSTHSSAEAAHSGYSHVTYQLDPQNGGMPDLYDLRNKVKYNDSISGILLLSPDNPTGAVYPRSLLEEIVKIAQEHKLFMIADEIYAHIVYTGYPRLHMSQWIEDVPALSMRGISKELPWPGARCGWIEVLNKDKDENFAAYVDSLLAAKRLEVWLAQPVGRTDQNGRLRHRTCLLPNDHQERLAAVLDDRPIQPVGRGAERAAGTLQDDNRVVQEDEALGELHVAGLGDDDDFAASRWSDSRRQEDQRERRNECTHERFPRVFRSSKVLGPPGPDRGRGGLCRSSPSPVPSRRRRPPTQRSRRCRSPTA